jgi:hypothetical protein
MYVTVAVSKQDLRLGNLNTAYLLCFIKNYLIVFAALISSLEKKRKFRYLWQWHSAALHYTEIWHKSPLVFSITSFKVQLTAATNWQYSLQLSISAKALGIIASPFKLPSQNLLRPLSSS